MGVLVLCDKCKNGVGVKLYGLRRYGKKKDDEHPSNASNPYQGRFESAGSIYLCDACWSRIAQPRMRPNRRPKTTRNQFMEDAQPNPRVHPWRERPAT